MIGQSSREYKPTVLVTLFWVSNMTAYKTDTANLPSCLLDANSGTRSTTHQEDIAMTLQQSPT